MKIYDPKTGKPIFQKTRQRVDEPGQARELTFSCYRGFPFLSRDRTRTWFIEELEAARKKTSFDLWAYVIMPEHIHLLICPKGPTVSAGVIVGGIKEALARNAIAYLRANSPQWLPRIAVREGDRVRYRFWQPGGGYDRNVVEIATVHQMIEYIHTNPIRRGLVERADDWEWSSARWYAGVRPVQIDMDGTIPALHKTERR